MKRGAGARPLLKSEVRDAQDRARSAAEAARLLEVSYTTYKKYAKMYGLFGRAKNQAGIGLPKGFSMTKGRYPLVDIFAGKYPNYPRWKLMRRMVRNGVKEEACECCGYSEQRITDHKCPLKLSYKDGNNMNLEYDNLEILCFNCYFVQVGNLHGKQSQIEEINDN